MTKIHLMLKTHQPRRINEYSFFDLGKHKSYFNEGLNRIIIQRIAENCYLPTIKLLKRLIKESQHTFKFSLSISGTTIDQLEKYRPDIILKFLELISTGNVEVLNEPYYHSLAYFYSKDEFFSQVELHRKKIKDLFNVEPVTFVNTELTYNNQIGVDLFNLGFKGILAEGAEWALRGANSDYEYFAKDADLNVFFRNHGLSNDVVYRFSDKSREYYPLKPSIYYKWLLKPTGDILNLFWDFETFGEYHKKESNIFSFLEKLIKKITKSRNLEFAKFSETMRKSTEINRINIPQTVSWADQEKDLSAWRSNAMQYEALVRIYELEKQVKELHDPEILKTWRNLQTSDHFYYMSTKGFTDGAILNYFSPFLTPHDAYRYYMNVLSDFEIMINKTIYSNSLHKN